MVLCKVVRRNYGGKLLVSIKYQNLHSFKERVILLCQSILKMRRISHLHGSALFAIPFRLFYFHVTIYGIFHNLYEKGIKNVTVQNYTAIPLFGKQI